MSAIVPISRVSVSVRPATLDDIPFMDGLQAQYPKQLGRFATSWFEGYIRTGGVLVAEERDEENERRRDEVRAGDPAHSVSSSLSLSVSPRRLGYVISRDRYQKRDELGIIYHLCVAPGVQRKLVGAELIKAVFDRSAYGCKLYCCWCAQDIDANYFWESMGFLPIAFRAGSRSKSRVHIFWQRRIIDGDTGEKATPYWYPCQTSAGAMGEGRLVLPIPPGVHWRSQMPILLPEAQKALPEEKPATRGGGMKKPQKTPTLMPPTRRGARFGPPPEHDIPEPVVEKPKPEKKKREKVKVDPAHVAKARDLRDRYLEHLNSGALALGSAGKYNVSRVLPAPAASAAQDAPVAILASAQPKQLPHPLPTAA